MLNASFIRVQEMWRPGVAFAAYIPLCAPCGVAFIGDTVVSAVPIRQFHGAADDYVPVGACRAYYERLRAAGKDAELTVFPDAHHAFDNPLGPKTPTVVKGGQTVRACNLKEEPLGVIMNVVTGQPFSYKDACVEIDPDPGLTLRFCAALVRLKCRAATSNAHRALSGGTPCMRLSHLSCENASFVTAKYEGQDGGMSQDYSTIDRMER